MNVNGTKSSRRFILAALASSVAMTVLPAAAQKSTPKPALSKTTKPAPASKPAAKPPAAPAPAPVKTPAAATATTGGPVHALAGALLPNGRMIRAHWGDISPFYGQSGTYWGPNDPLSDNAAPFWGTLQPYARMIRAHEGDIAATARMIRAHWGELDGMARMIRAHYDAASTSGLNETELASLFGDFVNTSESFWGAAVTAETGKSFRAGFADAVLAEHGIDLAKPNTLSSLTESQREFFFLSWHDGLMQYSGADQADHWMKLVNWTPKLTQTQGSGSRAVIGILDFFVAHDEDIKSKVAYWGGYQVTDNHHGAGVASLLVASHDGKGIMGIAPRAKVAAYNPFDSSQTANWDDVRKGIVEVNKHGTSVLNLSLGVPGYTFHPEWRNIFKTSAIDSYKDKQIYVIAAGNSGTVQAQNVEMNGALDSTFLVVGSVDPSANISSFSNQPGWTCLTDGGQCKNTQRFGVGKTGDRFSKSDYLKESGYLMNRFLVAPGEMILVADGTGGVTRMSGTSFSAPLVAGAVALIHDRWPWLKSYPRDVAKILLDSARDLGEPGADPVYGRGLLDVEAAQSALDFSKLKYELWNGTKKSSMSIATLRDQGIQSTWEANGVYFSAFEKIDSAERDFLIPLSSRLFGTTKNGQYFQEFVYNHFVNWVNSLGFTGGGAPTLGFSDVRENGLMAKPGGWSFSMTGRLVGEHYRNGGMGMPTLRSAMTLRSPGEAFSMTVGSGDGALNLGGALGLQTTADFDPYSGGVNPLLGFASGGAHIGSTLRLSPSTHLSVGVTNRRRTTEQELRNLTSIEDRARIGTRGGYGASALNVRVDYRPLPWLGMSAGYTRLSEDEAFMGIRSLASSDFGEGTVTDGLTLSADVAVTDTLTLFGSATGARSVSPDEAAAFRIGGAGAVGTAYQLGIAKARLLGKSDRLRLTVSQPLTTERGSIDFTSVQVIDRETGAKGLVTQSFGLEAPRRRYVAEAKYGTTLMDGRADLGLFGRGELGARDTDTPRLMIGAQAGVAF